MPSASYSAEIPDLAPSWRRSLRAENKSPKTIKAYLAAVEQFTAWLVEHDRPTTIADVGRGDVQGFIGHLLDTRTAATAATRYRGLQQFYRWAVAEQEVAVSPMQGMTPPKLDETPVPVVPDDDLRALLKVCAGTTFEDRRDAAIIRTFIDTGARLAELAGLEVADLDLDQKAMHVMGKGRRGRVVPLGRNAVRDLDRYLRVRPRHARRDLSALWLGPRGGMTDSGIAQMIRRRCGEAGIPVINPHRFRHTWAHSVKAAGASNEVLKAIGGWRSDQMLERYGSSLAAERAREAHERFSPGDRL